MFNRNDNRQSGSHLEQYKLEFSARFSNEDDCIEALEKRLNKSESAVCQICEGTDLRRGYGRRTGYCMRCRRKVRTKAAELLAGLHSAKPVLFVIWLAERGDSITPVQLEKLMNIPRSTARRALQRVKETVINSVSAANQLRFDPPAPKAHAEVVIDTPKPSEKAEQSKIDDIQSQNAEPDISNLEVTKARDLELARARDLELAKARVFESITSQPISFEELCRRCELNAGRAGTVLTMLELDNLVLRLPGDRYVRKSPTASAERPSSMEKPQKRSAQAGMSQKLSKDFITLVIHIPRDGAQNVDVGPYTDGANSSH